MKRTIYEGTRLEEISFPLGGIGTGSLGLAGNGRLIDWEIYNKPAKGSTNGFSSFAVKASRGGKTLDARILSGDTAKGLWGNGYGLPTNSMAGFPHFRECSFTGEYPIAELSLSDADSPIKATLRAFNPFIPHNAKDSSIPAAFFEITVTNTTAEPLTLSVAANLKNPYAGHCDHYFESGSARGIKLTGSQTDRTKPDYGELVIATDAEDISYQEYWYRGGWQDRLETWWRNFTECGSLTNRTYEDGGDADDHATLMARREVGAHESFTVRYLLAWYNPIKPDQWKHGGEPEMLVPNYYSFVFDGAESVAKYCLAEWERLSRETRQYHDELFASTLPEEVLDAVSATSSVLKTETSIRIGEKGDFYGWEGLGPNRGSCEGTCTHVWNYAYALCFLFPELERGIRENDFNFNQKPSGGMTFRTRIPFGRGIGGFRACVDGQMGGVIKTYREWKLSGDTEWLRSLWPQVKKSLEFAWSDENPDRWDRDRDGVLEGRQHHTLDMELFGPSSWLEGFYLAALKAGAEMARALGEEDFAAECADLLEKGQKFTRDELFNGEYFIQKLDVTDESVFDAHPDAKATYWNDEAKQIKYQYGEGCEIDQLLAQWHADLVGLGDIFDPEQVKTALTNMYRYNFKESMRSHYNPWRIFALNDESGAIICEWPEGIAKPAIPLPYAQESMHGFEYSFAGLLISRGFIDEGLRIVKSIRDRYRGDNRNPWNEIECGSNYARSMASFALIPLLSGMSFDLTKGELGFAPKVNASDFRSIFAVGTGWGRIEISADEARLTLLAGELKLRRLTLPVEAKSLEIDGSPVEFTREDDAYIFAETTVRQSIVLKP